jgi:hypothetical protein
MLADANNMFFVVEVTEKARFIVRDDQPGSGKKALLGLGRRIGAGAEISSCSQFSWLRCGSCHGSGRSRFSRVYIACFLTRDFISHPLKPGWSGVHSYSRVSKFGGRRPRHNPLGCESRVSLPSILYLLSDIVLPCRYEALTRVESRHGQPNAKTQVRGTSRERRKRAMMCASVAVLRPGA